MANLWDTPIREPAKVHRVAVRVSPLKLYLKPTSAMNHG